MQVFVRTDKQVDLMLDHLAESIIVLINVDHVNVWQLLTVQQPGFT